MQPLRNEFVALDIQLQQLLRGLESMLLPTVNIDKALAEALEGSGDENDNAESDSKEIQDEEDFYKAFYPHLIQYQNSAHEAQEVCKCVACACSMHACMSGRNHVCAHVGIFAQEFLETGRLTRYRYSSMAIDKY